MLREGATPAPTVAELVEITPASIRLRKQILAELERRRAKPAA